VPERRGRASRAAPPPWRTFSHRRRCPPALNRTRQIMNSIIYLVGLVVIVLAILSFVGLR
jgi:hypothetical protein